MVSILPSIAAPRYYSDKLLEANAILDGKPLVYVDSEYHLEDKSPESQLSLLSHHLGFTQIFLCWMWLIKDNSINFDLGFLQYPFNNSRNSIGTRVSSNGRTIWFTKSDGTLTDTTFNTDDLRAAIAFNRSYIDARPSEQAIDINPIGPIRDDSRLARAFYFLQAARGAGYLPEKIAYYCTCFETLVSTSPTELAHQVAERVAILLANDTPEAATIYRNMKSAYDTRSKLVHGGYLSKDQARYVTQSVNCDMYLRRLFRLVQEDQELEHTLRKPSIEVDQYFLERLFHGAGVEPVPLSNP